MNLHPILRCRATPGAASHLRRALALASLAAISALTACGGGGGGDAAAPPGPVAPAALQISGTAAVGGALAGAAVQARCASGSGTATAGADGRFTLQVAGGSLPCVLRASADGTVLHSLAGGSGSNVVANISPLTDLVLAQALGAESASAFAAFDAATQARLDAATLAAATAAVRAALQSVVALDGVNPFTDPLVAATATAAGNGQDALLDALAARLAAASLALADLRALIIANGPAAAAVVAAQVQPAAAHCASLRSGPYMTIDIAQQTLADGEDPLHRIEVDAATLTVRGPDGTLDPAITPVAGKPCQFSANGGRTNLVVSPAGVVFSHDGVNDGGGSAELSLGVPLQVIAQAELAGTWNSVALLWGAGAGANEYVQWTVAAGGTSATVLDCPANGACSADSVQVAIAANPAGGFDVSDSSGLVLRLLAYRSAGGQLMLVGASPQGGVVFASRQTPLAVPALGEVQTYWSAGVNSRVVATNLTADVRTIAAADAAAGTYGRSPSYTGVTDSITINSPRPGMRTRETCVSASGVATACGLVSLPLTGMGITVHGSSNTAVGRGFLDFGILRPAGSTATGVQAAASVPGAAATLGTLVQNGGEAYPLRASLTIDGAGQINGGQYDFHKLAGTMTPCTYSPANAAACFGTNAGFNSTSQGGPISTEGSASPISLRAGPDQFGYTFTGTLSGTVWTGTFTRTSDGLPADAGSFSVNLVITRQ